MQVGLHQNTKNNSRTEPGDAEIEGFAGVSGQTRPGGDMGAVGREGIPCKL